MDYDINDKARSRVRRIKGFYIHFGIYVIVSVFLLFINMLTDPFSPWFLFPVSSWGVAIAIHYLAVFGIPGMNILTERWEEEEFERQLERLQRRRSRHEERYLDTDHLSAEDILELQEIRARRSGYRTEDMV
ncbi:MAG: 2TM domain-containing protein [Bacteroidota bacterium]